MCHSKSYWFVENSDACVHLVPWILEPENLADGELEAPTPADIAVNYEPETKLCCKWQISQIDCPGNDAGNSIIARVMRGWRYVVATELSRI